MNVKKIYKLLDIESPFNYKKENYRNSVTLLNTEWTLIDSDHVLEIEDFIGNTQVKKILQKYEILGTNTIEGEFSSRRDIEKTINSKEAPTQQKDKKIKGILNSLDYLMDKKYLDKEILLEAYSELTFNGEILDEEDKYFRPYRNDSVSIYKNLNGSDKQIHAGLSHDKIEKEMDSLMEFINSNELRNNPILKASFTHLIFETIHPYFDGNGRMGRVILNWILTNSYGTDVSGISFVINKYKREYYKSISDSRANNTSIYIYAFFKFIINKYNIIIKFINKYYKQLSDNDLHVMLTIMTSSVEEFTWKDIIEWLEPDNKLEKTSVINSLNNLEEKNLLKKEVVGNKHYFSMIKKDD